MNESRHNPFENDPLSTAASEGHLPADPERTDDFEFALMQSSANLNPIDEDVVDIDSLTRELDSLMARTAVEFSAPPAMSQPVEAEPQLPIRPGEIEVDPLPAVISPMVEMPSAPSEPDMPEQPIERDTAEAHAATALESSDGAATVDTSENAQLVAGAAEPLKSVDESLAKDIDEMLKTDSAVAGGIANDQTAADALKSGALSPAADVEAIAAPAVSDQRVDIKAADGPFAGGPATSLEEAASPARLQGLAPPVVPKPTPPTVEVQPAAVAAPAASPPAISHAPAEVASVISPIVQFQQVVTPKSGGLTQAVVAALLLLNLPFRLVPRALLPAMNLVAITLALWVPVVWFVLPGLVNRDPPPQVVDEMHHQSMLRVEPENRAATSGGGAGSSKSGGH